jgi:hypothetical protein
MATIVIFVTSTGAVTVPADFGTLVSVEVIGGGAGGKPAPSGAGGEGGGGGAYSSSTAVTGITASGTVYVSTGAGGASGVAGGDTWFNAASNAAPTLTTQGALAKGGAIGASGTGGLGGASEKDTAVSTTAATTCDTFAVATHRSASIVAQITQGSNYQVGKYLVIHDGTTATMIEESAVATGSMLGTFTVSISGGNVLFRVNMTSASSATVTTLMTKVSV